MLSPEARSPSLKVFNGQTVPIICEDGYTVPNKSSDMLEMSTRAYLQARDPLRNPIIRDVRVRDCDQDCVTVDIESSRCHACTLAP